MDSNPRQGIELDRQCLQKTVPMNYVFKPSQRIIIVRKKLALVCMAVINKV